MYAQELGVPTPLQQIINAMPAIPIPLIGKNLKFDFGDDYWIAKVNENNFLAGNCIFEETGNGYILTLKTTNVWSGAVEEVIDLLQKAGVPLGPAAGPIRTAAKLSARIAKWIPLKGSAIILEYTEGPPVNISFIKMEKQEDDTRITDAIAESREIKTDHNPRLNTVGVSVGSSFGVPWFVSSVHTTYSFFPYTFFEIGLDLGGQAYLSVWDNSKQKGYFFSYPYINFNGFVPFNKGGWFAGIGFGVMFSRFSYYGGFWNEVNKEVWLMTPAINLNTGFVLGNWFTLSYTQRIRLGGIGTNGKFSLGFVWRY
jgi:hypothetical protein